MNKCKDMQGNVRIASPSLETSLGLYTHNLNFSPRYSNRSKGKNRVEKTMSLGIPHILECDECFQVWVMSSEVAVKRTKRGIS